MKKISILAFTFGALLFLGSCDNAASKIKSGDNRTSDMADAVNTNRLPEFSFESEFHDFGNLVAGEKVEHIFTFTNTGEAPLIISKAEGSCGCTVPVWPREPILPGAKGEIKVNFDSTNRAGRQDKTVKLYANTAPNQKVLKITSEVDNPDMQ
jgi:hypothetical protein